MSTTFPPHAPLPPALSDLLARELSPAARVGHVLLLLVSTGMTVLLLSLWLTEPVLPPRTRIAFACMSLVGLAWALYAVWVLRARRVPLSAQALVAARMACAFCAMYFLGACLLAATSERSAMVGAACGGLLMLVAAAAMLRRAHGRHAALEARRAELERQLRHRAS